MAYVYVKNEADALDVVQEVAYQSFRHIRALKDPAYLKTWLMKITINTALAILQKNSKIVPLLNEVEAYRPADRQDLALAVTLQELLEMLNEEEKHLILLRYYQDLTFKEIANALDMPLGTVKSAIYRALKKLRRTYKEAGYDEQSH